MLTYNDCKALFNTARNKNKGKPLGNNLRLIQIGDKYAIKHHSTNIVIIDSNNNYTLNNGGWYSVTTKKHLNNYSPIKLYQRAGVWYFDNNRLFFNNLTVDFKGNIAYSTIERPVNLPNGLELSEV